MDARKTLEKNTAEIRTKLRESQIFFAKEEW